MAALTPQKEQAAVLVYEDRLTDEQIASELGVSRKTLSTWKTQPTFQRRVDAIRQEFADAIVAEGITNRQNRLDELNDLYSRTKQVLLDRAADPTMADVPGGPSGTIVRTWKQMGAGDTAQLVEEYRVDVGTNRDLKDTMKQAAIEMGQWSEKIEHGGEITIRRYIGIDPSQV